MTTIHTTTRDINLPDPIDANYRQGSNVSEKKSDRDELLEVTSIGPDCFTNGTVICYKGENYTRMPRTIETVSELDALDPESAVRSDAGIIYEKCFDVDGREFDYWLIPGEQRPQSARKIDLPATVLYEPGAGE